MFGTAGSGEGALDLEALGWATEQSTAFAAHERCGLLPGRVARVDRGVLEVLCPPRGLLRATPSGDLLEAAVRDPAAAACTGDWVACRTWPDARVTVEAVLPRRTALVRASASGRGHGQVLAVNVDIVVVVVSLSVEPDLGRLERLLALAWESGATPVVALTKADLVTDAAAVADETARAAPGAAVVVVSAMTGEGLQALVGYVGSGRTAALVGVSGAGKSTLANALAGATLLPTAAVRGDGKGRHTTTSRELVVLPQGGVLIDTPGLRSVGLWDVGDGLDLAFADVGTLALACRFVDCRHESEPGCAVLVAITAGELPPRRLDSWRRLQREARWVAARGDARLQAQARRAARVRSRASRQGPTNRP